MTTLNQDLTLKSKVYCKGLTLIFCDLENDPDEVRNLYHDPAFHQVVDAHRRRLVSRLIRMDDPLPDRPYDV